MQGDVMSDAANVASRIEGLCRVYGAGILASDRTFYELQDGDQFHSRSLGTIRVKGRESPVGLFEICDGDAKEVAAIKWATRHEFAEALALYTSGETGLARRRFARLFERNPQDRAASFYLDQIDRLDEPPLEQTFTQSKTGGSPPPAPTDQERQRLSSKTAIR